MPKEIKDKETFTKLVEAATEVRLSRNGDGAKVKLRTKGILYTFRTTTEEADSLVKGVKAPVVEY